MLISWLVILLQVLSEVCIALFLLIVVIDVHFETNDLLGVGTTICFVPGRYHCWSYIFCNICLNFSYWCCLLKLDIDYLFFPSGSLFLLIIFLILYFFSFFQIMLIFFIGLSVIYPINSFHFLFPDIVIQIFCFQKFLNSVLLFVAESLSIFRYIAF